MNGKPFAVVPVGDHAAVVTAAADDGHRILTATHMAVRDGAIVGAFNIGPLVTWWLHSGCTRMDSLFMLCALETLQAQHGFRRWAFLIQDASPYMPLMERMGFNYLGDFKLYAKGE